MIGLSYGVKCGQKFFFVSSRFRRLTDRRTDKQTDRQTDGRISHGYTAPASAKPLLLLFYSNIMPVSVIADQIKMTFYKKLLCHNNVVLYTMSNLASNTSLYGVNLCAERTSYCSNVEMNVW